MKISIDGKVYDRVDDLEGMRLDLLDELEDQTGLLFPDVQRIHVQAGKLSEADLNVWAFSREGRMQIAIGAWLAMRMAGESVSIADVKAKRILPVEEPGDVVPLEQAGPPRPRAGSVRGAGHQPRTARPKARSVSASKS